MGCPLPGGLTVKRFVINWGGGYKIPLSYLTKSDKTNSFKGSAAKLYAKLNILKLITADQ